MGWAPGYFQSCLGTPVGRRSTPAFNTSSPPAGIFNLSLINQASKMPFISFVRSLRNGFLIFFRFLFSQQKGAKGSFNTSRPLYYVKVSYLYKVHLRPSECIQKFSVLGLGVVLGRSSEVGDRVLLRNVSNVAERTSDLARFIVITKSAVKQPSFDFRSWHLFQYFPSSYARGFPWDLAAKVSSYSPFIALRVPTLCMWVPSHCWPIALFN